MSLDFDMRMEREEFSELSEKERHVIAMCLDAVATVSPLEEENLQRHARWGREIVRSKHIDEIALMSVWGLMRSCRHVFSSTKSDPVLNFNGQRLAPMIEVGVFLMRLGLLESEAAYRFLAQRLFGGECVPLISPAYAACLLHPEVMMELTDETAEKFWHAAVERSMRPSENEATFFPSIEDVIE